MAEDSESLPHIFNNCHSLPFRIPFKSRPAGKEKVVPLPLGSHRQGQPQYTWRPHVLEVK